MGVSERPLEVAADSALFPSANERQRCDQVLAETLADAAQRLRAGPVAPKFDLEAFRRDLAAFDFSTPRPLDELLPWTIERLEHGLVHLTHPRYFGLFNPAPTYPALCAERIVSVFNPQLASSKTSPAAVEIEAHVVGAVARRA